VKKQLSLGALALSLLLVVGGGCTIGRKGFDWPARRGPGGNGISKETGWNPKALAGGPKILWQANIGNGYANVAIRDNLLVTMGTKEGFTTIYLFFRRSACRYLPPLCAVGNVLSAAFASAESVF